MTWDFHTSQLELSDFNFSMLSNNFVVTQSKVDVDAMFVQYNEFCNKDVQWLSSGLITFYSSASTGAQSL